MENIRQQALLIYDLFTFNFDIENPNATGEILLEREGLGADLPAELFPQILYWLKHSDNRRQIQRLHFRHYEELSDWEIINFRNQLNMANPLFADGSPFLPSNFCAVQSAASSMSNTGQKYESGVRWRGVPGSSSSRCTKSLCTIDGTDR